MSTWKNRCILEVPYQEKDEAKELGAWWDPDIKKWFVPVGRDVSLFSKWIKKDDTEQQPTVE